MYVMMMRIIMSRKFSCTLPTFLRYARSCSTVKGRATIEGTKSFVNKSNLKLFHKFHLSELFITPIIHGSPNEEYDQKLNDLMMEKAIVENRSNCVIVYHCKDPIPTESKMTMTPSVIWGTDSLAKIISNPSHSFLREEFVVGANLGYAVTPQQIRERHAEALKMSNLEYLDFVIIEVCDAVLDRLVDIQVFQIGQTLQTLCEEDKLHFLAVKASLAPFIYHTPAFRKYGKYMTIPVMFENEMEEDDYYVDLVIYPISPSISMPTSYPMLDANPESVDLANIEEKGGDLERTITRAASDPFTCYRGLGSKESQEAEMEEIQQRSDDDSKPSNVPLNALNTKEQLPWYLVDGLIPPPADKLIASALDELCPQLKSTPLLQEKALRCVFSAGVEVVLVDAELSATLGPLNLRPDQLLSPHDSEDVFLNFSMPDMNNISEEEGEEQADDDDNGDYDEEEEEEEEEAEVSRRK